MRFMLTLVAAALPLAAAAAITADEAKALGTTLTAVGAERPATRTAAFPPIPAA
jgi:hypothetical protein